MPQSGTVLPHESDHIRSQKHGGPTTLENLCWACAWCNSFKGTDVAAFVPVTNELVRLFNPRTDTWEDHFYWEGPIIRGKTPVGLAVIELLRLNRPERADHRRLLMDVGNWS
jgi:hypothetical protein